MTTKTCASCALADCNQAGLVEVCERWTDRDDEEEAAFEKMLMLGKSATIEPLLSFMVWDSARMSEELRKISVLVTSINYDFRCVESWESEGGAL